MEIGQATAHNYNQQKNFSVQNIIWYATVFLILSHVQFILNPMDTLTIDQRIYLFIYY